MSEKNFKGSLGNYHLITTDSGDITLWSEYFNENFHSLDGAFNETRHNYIDGCQLINKLNADLTILDIGFGLGIGLLATLDFINQQIVTKKFKHKLNYFSVELDEELVKWTLTNSLQEKINPFKKTTSDGLTVYTANIPNFAATILIGEATQTLMQAKKSNLIPSANAIFQDAFSPTTNPSLWSVEWFTLLHQLSAADVLLATYSSASVVLKNLQSAGWNVSKIAGFGRKKHIIQAKLS